VYTIITNRIIEHLEKGVVPWRQPWTDAGLPKNLITGKPYRGINVWLLASLNYSQNYFLSFKQVQDIGATVKKGEKSQEVVFWKWIEKETSDMVVEEEKQKKIPMLRYYRVFNIAQCEGIPKEKIPVVVERKNNPIERCEKILEEMPLRPKIQHLEQKAYYRKSDDVINMPRMETFDSIENYYGTLFHEVLHSTGHAQRLNRRELIRGFRFASEDYAIEELTAEMGASYLKSYSGIPIEKLENNAAYIQSWLERLKKDKKCIVYASSQAQKATDYILNVRIEEKEVELADQTLEEGKPSDRRAKLQATREGKQDKSIEEERSNAILP